jgi:hypothetical protein
MTQKYPKRLIEVDLPIKELSKLRNKRPSLGDLNVRRVGCIRPAKYTVDLG